MAITLRHDAAAVGVDPSGSGNPGRKFGQTLVLQQQQNAQENLQRSQDRLFDITRMRLGNQFQMDRDKRMVQADKDLLKQRMDAQDAQFMKRRELEKQDLDAAIQRDMLQQSTRMVEQRVADVRGMLNQNQYTPEGQKLLGDLSGELRAIEAQRDAIRPKEYNALLHQWLDKAERAGLDKFVAKPPTINDTMAGNFKDLGTGYGVFLQPDGKMDVREIDPRKVEEGKARASVGGRSGGDRGILQMQPVDMASDPEMLMKYREDAIEDLKAEWEKANPDAESDAPEPTEEQIEDRTFALFDRRKQEAARAERFRKRMMQKAVAMEQSGPQAIPQPDPPLGRQDGRRDGPYANMIPQPDPALGPDGPANMIPQPDPPLGRTVRENMRRAMQGEYAGPRDDRGDVSGATIKDLQQVLDNNPETKGRKAEDLLSDEALNYFQQNGSENPRQDAIDYYTNYMSRSMPRQGKGVKVTEIKDPVARTQAAMMPRPKSADEFMKMVQDGTIKPGDMIVMPDNSLQEYNPQ